jgi:hypothetical protein
MILESDNVLEAVCHQTFPANRAFVTSSGVEGLAYSLQVKLRVESDLNHSAYSIVMEQEAVTCDIVATDIEQLIVAKLLAEGSHKTLACNDTHELIWRCRSASNEIAHRSKRGIGNVFIMSPRTHARAVLATSILGERQADQDEAYER